MHIRVAESADAPAVAALHIRAWQWAYEGLISADYLAGLPEQLPRRERFWRELLDAPGPEARTWVAEAEGRIVGFVTVGPSRDPDAGDRTGEVRAVYLDRDVVGKGFGRALFARAQDPLRESGSREATLWVLERNVRARRFYEAAGWRPDGGAKTEEIGGAEQRELRYRVTFDIP